MNEHFNSLKRNDHQNYKIQLAFNIHGINNFKFKILEFVDNESELNAREAYWIETLKSNIEEFGYNMSYYIETENGVKEKHSVESNLKISKSKIGVKRGKINWSTETIRKQKLMYKYLTPEIRERIKKSNQDTLGGIPISESRKQAVSLGNRGKSTKLTEGEVREILELFKKGEMSIEEISDLYKISTRSLYSIRSGKSWAHITKPYINENGILYKQTEQYIKISKKILKLTEKQAIEVIDALNSRLVTHKQLAEKYGVGIKCIANIANKKTWTHLPRNKPEDIIEPYILENNYEIHSGCIEKDTLM
jgi:hypothetical protein